MNDTELLELCREVYERFPEWKHTDFYHYKRDGDRHITYKNMESGFTLDAKDHLVPLYTSDYILEKLPHASYQMDVTSVGVKLTTFYTDQNWETVHANTPLKALLKLTIALDNVKELPHA